MGLCGQQPSDDTARADHDYCSVRQVVGSILNRCSSVSFCGHKGADVRPLFEPAQFQRKAAFNGARQSKSVDTDHADLVACLKEGPAAGPSHGMVEHEGR